MISFGQCSLILLVLFRKSTANDAQPGNCFIIDGDGGGWRERACCMPDETCRLASKSDCCDSGGLYVSKAAECTEGLCASTPTGACCKRNGGCAILTEKKCKEAAWGVYHGDDSTCSEVTCKREPGACFTADKTCRMAKNKNKCTKDFNGEFYGHGMPCLGPGEGACCTRKSVWSVLCTIGTRKECKDLDGSFTAEGVPCPHRKTCPVTRHRRFKIVSCCNEEKGTCDYDIIKPLCEATGGRVVESCDDESQCPVSFPRPLCCFSQDECKEGRRPQKCKKMGGKVLPLEVGTTCGDTTCSQVQFDE